MRRVGIIVAVAALVPLVGWQLLERGVVWFNAPSRAEHPVRGLDVSHHQGEIDWAAVAEEGLDFAYIKATEGGDFRDPRFEENFEGAAAAGLRRGAYHFFTLCRSGLDQAENVLGTVPRTDDALPIAVDLEFGGNCGRRPPWREVERELSALLSLLERELGAPPLLYVTEAFLSAYPVHTLGHDLWIRSIYSSPRRSWAVWQYHCRARIAGVEGPVDLNVGGEAWWARVRWRDEGDR